MSDLDLLEVGRHFPLFDAFSGSFNYLLNYKVHLGCTLPCLWLQWRYGVTPRRSFLTPGFLVDSIYPFMKIFAAVIVLSGALTVLREFYTEWLPWANVGILSGQPAWVQFLAAFLLQDFLRYWTHRAHHRVPWLWHFHAIHHSQRVMNPNTAHRVHPFEVLTNAAIVLLGLGVIGGNPVLWVYSGLFSQFWGQLSHASIRTNFGLLGWILVSPQNHRVHRSIETRHQNTNFGTLITIWDILFGTLARERHCYPDTGIQGADGLLETSFLGRAVARVLWVQMIYPFQKIAHDIARGAFALWRGARGHRSR